MVKLKPGEHYMIIGSTGSGKTYFAKKVLLPPWPRVLVIDTENMQFEDYKELKTTADKVISKLPKDKAFRFRYVPEIEWKEELEVISQDLLLTGRNMVIYIDEVTDFSDAHVIGPEFSALVRKARKRDISVFAGTQRPQGVNKWLFSNAIWKQFFYTQPFDRKYLDDLYPGIAESVGQIKWHTYESILVGPDGEMKYLGSA